MSGADGPGAFLPGWCAEAIRIAADADVPETIALMDRQTFAEASDTRVKHGALRLMDSIRPLRTSRSAVTRV